MQPYAADNERVAELERQLATLRSECMARDELIGELRAELHTKAELEAELEVWRSSPDAQAVEAKFRRPASLQT